MNWVSRGASAASAGTATPHGASRRKKRPGRWIGCASDSSRKATTGARSQMWKTVKWGSPSSPSWIVISAAGGRSPSWSKRAQAAARSSRRRPSSSFTSAALSALNGNRVRPSPASVPRSSSSGRSPWRVRTRKWPRPSRATTVQTARQRSESLSQASTSGLGTRSGNCASSSSTGLASFGCAGTRQCLRRQSNQRRGSSLTASFRSSLNAKSKTSSGSRGLSERSQTCPETGSESR